MSNAQQHGPARGPGGPAAMAVPGEKPKNFKKAASRFIDYCRPYGKAMIISFVLAVMGAVCTIIGPGKIQDIVELITDGLMTGIDLDAIAKIGVFLVVLYALGSLFSYIQGFIMGTVSAKLSKSMRAQISEKINRLPLRYFDKISYGDVLSRVTNDVDTIGQTLNMSLSLLVSSLALFLGSLVMMFATNATMALTAVGSTIFGFIAMMIVVTKSQRFFKAQQNELGNINGHIEETYSGLNIVRAYNNEEASLSKFDEINDRLYKSAWKSQFISGIMMPMMNFIGNFGYVAVCVVGAVLTMKGTIGFEVIVAFMIYVRLFSQPLSQLAQTITNLQSTAAASERVFDFLDEQELPPEAPDAVSEHEAAGNVEFRGIKFGYTPEKPVIKDFSAVARPGQKIAIVGPTGSGKTTMVNLLMRFYELDAGEILIDGIPATNMTRECIHSQFGMVLQDTWVFEGTIRDNIAFKNEAVTDEQIVAACKAVGLDHYIRTLPDGYDTKLSDNNNLSAGQRQLLTIARAIVEDAPLLILDEATSSVDTRTEIQIQKAMERLTEGRTSFIIAHRLSTIKSADLILVMRDGCIVERGTHEQLLAENGFYAQLYNSQFDEATA
jgi:ATP-binding cassette subfamily B protein